MKKKFVFVNLSIRSGYNSGINHGIAYLVPIIKRHSYEVSVINIRSEITPGQFLDKINSLSPDILAFSCMSNQFIHLCKYSNAVKDKKILQISGGVCATLEPERILTSTSIKGVCIGEGEIPLENLLNNIAHRTNILDTHGFYWEDNGGIKKNPVSEFVSDLTSLDFPDYTVFDDLVVSNHGILLITISRGCPYNCSYCCNEAIKSVYASGYKYFRIPSVEHSIILLERIISRYPRLKTIQFEDDLLIANEAWFKDFAVEYKKKIKLPYSCCVRAEYINKNIVGLMKQSGCVRALIGLESGNEHLRNKILNRKYSNANFIEKAKIIKDEGIKLYTFNIVGFPFEGKKEINDTLELNKRIEPDDGVCTFFYPYRGTELYRICEQEGLLKDEKDTLKITNYNTKPAIRLKGLTEKECVKFQKIITFYLIKQSFKYEYKKFCNSCPGIKRYPYFVYLWLTVYVKPILMRIIYNYDMLFSYFTKAKEYLYYKGN